MVCTQVRMEEDEGMREAHREMYAWAIVYVMSCQGPCRSHCEFLYFTSFLLLSKSCIVYKLRLRGKTKVMVQLWMQEVLAFRAEAYSVSGV